MTPDAVERTKRSAAGLSLGTNVAFTVLKVVAAALTGSVALFSEAAHSATDVVASGIAYASIRAASAPPDEEHPYGHGKIESLAGFAESVMLLFVVVYVVATSVPRIVHPAPVESLGLGLGVMGASALGSLFVGLYVARIGKQADSLALQSNGQHLLVDFWTSLGVFLALGITRLTGWAQADAVVALFLAAWIARNAWRMSNEAFQQLIDRRISDEDLQCVHGILAEEREMLSFHKLRTRHSGNWHYVDLHVVVPRDWSLVQAHELADRIEKRIEAALTPARAVVHVDPYDPARVR